MNKLQVISVIGLIIYFAVLLIAVSRFKKNKDVLDYFFASRTLPFWALAITFIASWWGAGSALSTADLSYSDGMGAYWYYGVAVLISTSLMILFSKAIRRVGYLTQGQMMESRYNKATSKMLSIMIFLFMTFTCASQMVGIGTFFSTYLDISYVSSVLIGTLIVLIYSMIGGFRAVVLTDIIQFVLLLLASLLVFGFAYYYSGGWSNIKLYAQSIGKENYTNFFGDRTKYLAYVITFGSSWMIQANVWQRISATKNETDAKKMTVLSFFVFIFLYLIVVITGMAGLVIFKDGLPEGGVIINIIKYYMNPVIATIVFIGISAAIMSTMDSLISTGAMTLSLDLINKEDNNLVISKVSTLIVSVIAISVALKIRDILIIGQIASDIITTGIFIPLVFGFIFRRGNSKGAMSSMVVGFIYSFYNSLVALNLGLPFLIENGTTRIIVGIVLSSIFYFGVSLLTKPEYDKADSFINKAFNVKLK